MSRSGYRSELLRAVGETLPRPETAMPPLPANALPGPWTAPTIPPGAETPAGGASSASGDQLLTLPAFKRASDIRPEQIRLPDLLINGVLHKGCKMVLSGGSKSFKSWTLIDLGLSVASGTEWLGHQTRKSRVLYINFELIEGFFEERVLSICRARRLLQPEDFLIWDLRGKCYDLTILAKILVARIAQTPDIGLIIVDPLYKALGGRDENSASEMAELMLQVERLGDTIGAAVVFGSHFSKGSQAGKEAMDRPSGSGVFVRDPDAIMVMTRHEDEGCYTIESELRYLAPLPKFVVRWEFPVMVLDESKDPSALYQGKPQPKPGDTNFEAKAPTFSADDVLNLLPHSGLLGEAWKRVVHDRFGKAGRDFYTRKAELLVAGQVIKEGNKYFPKGYKLHSV